MATIGKIYGGNIAVDFVNGTVDIVEHDASAKGLMLAGTLVTATAAELNALDGATATAAEISKLAGVTAGTVTASKAVVVDANKAVDTLDIIALKIDGVAVGSTAAEIDLQCDVSAQTETIDSGVAVSVLKRITKIDNTVTGAGAITLAAPDATMLGMVKIIEMTVDGGDVTLALTNVDGGSAATTATFDAVGDALVLVAGVSKWHVCSETATLS